MAIIPSTDKFFTHSEDVNTTIGGPASARAASHWYTINDLAGSVLPYKVFTALLTQSGGNEPDSNTNFPLVIGVTYEIYDNGGAAGYDFINVGAPNNEIGTKFIATGTTPNSWGTDVALRYNLGAPVATILENTIGDVWFTYNDAGNYFCNSIELFTTSKTFGLITPNTNFTNTPFFSIEIGASTASFIQILTSDNGTFSDDLLFNTPIEIRVYN